MLPRYLSLVGFSFLLCGFGAALTIEEITFSDRAAVDKSTLVINGVGLRTATIFKVKVYAAALYLKNKITTAAAVLDSPYPKVLEMEFLREIAGNDIQKAWDQSFEENCELDCIAGKAALQKLKALMVSVKNGDRMAYKFREWSVEVTFNGAPLGRVIDKNFPRSLLSTWVGKKPPTETLKTGLLGISDH